MKKYIFGFIGLIFGFGAGFGAGIYALPIIIAYNIEQQQKAVKNDIGSQQTLQKRKTSIVKKSPKKTKVKKTSIKGKKTGNKKYIYTGSFSRDAIDSDFFHNGTGAITIKNNTVVFSETVSLTPGPDYRLYAIKKYTETEDGFLAQKAQAVELSRITMFNGKQVFNIPMGIDISQYEAVLVWCEAFKQFITVARLHIQK